MTAGQEIPAASLGSLAFTPAANANGTGYASFTFQVKDNGGTAGGGVDTDQSANTFTINVTAVSDAPAGTSTTVTTGEDTPYTFGAADFGFTDASDSPANAFQSVILLVLPNTGTLTLAGVAVTAGDEVAVGSIGSLVWTPPADANGLGLDNLGFMVRDNGGTANGGQDQDFSLNFVTFNVTQGNDAPVNTLPATFSTNEDTALPLTGLSVADADNTTSTVTVTVTLTVDSGTLTGAAGGGVTVVGSGSGTLLLQGTLNSVNAFLSGPGTQPVFTPALNATGAVVLTMVTSDNGHTGLPGALTDTDTSTITVTSVNDEPAGADGSASILNTATKTFAAADFGFIGRERYASQLAGRRHHHDAAGERHAERSRGSRFGWGRNPGRQPRKPGVLAATQCRNLYVHLPGSRQRWNRQWRRRNRCIGKYLLDHRDRHDATVGAGRHDDPEPQWHADDVRHRRARRDRHHHLSGRHHQHARGSAGRHLRDRLADAADQRHRDDGADRSVRQHLAGR